MAWAGAERTENMYSMVVTLEVSKLSGWLNACAFCRVQKGGRLRGRQAGQETGGRGGGSISDAQRGPDWGVGGTGRRGAHMKHVPHVWDVGRVEAQRLVERIRALPRVQRQAQHEVDALGQETEGR